jgi:hypothetical protein
LSREDHRKYDAALQKIREMEKSQPNFEGFLPKEISSWCGAGIMAIALWLLAPKLGAGLTAVGLLVMFLLAIYPIKHTSVVLGEAVPQKQRKWAISLSILSIVLTVALGIFVWPVIGRHLTNEQRVGLGTLADNLPPNTQILVRVLGASAESQIYGKEIHRVFAEHHRAVPLPYTWVADVNPAPAGLIIWTRSGDDATGHAATLLMLGMEQIGMPTTYSESRLVNSNQIGIVVGVKPNYD